MTNEELDRLEALANAATPGPWRPCPQKSFIFGPSHEMIASRSRVQDEGEPEKGTVEIRGFGAGLPMDANHDFIVATSPDVVLRLVAELREARSSFDRTIDREDALRVDRDRLAAELAEVRAEVERLTVARDEALSGEHDAVRRAESAEIGCQIAYRREPTQEEGDAHGYDLADGAIPECHVPMGDHHGHRCRCGQWVWNGPTVCRRCVDADAVKIAIEWKAEAERLRKIFSDAGRGEHDVLALIDHYQDEARRSHEARCEACESSAAEIERLRAMVPSEDVIAEIRYAFGCTDYRPKDALAWLARIESAKENGR